MAQATLSNGQSALTFRESLNSMFTELYDAGFVDDNNNYVGNSAINSIDATALTEGTNGAYIAGGGTPSNGNHLGRVAKPNQAYGGTATDWTDDTAYGALTGALRANASNVATIGGGYDNINNQIAGTISGGGHNYIKYNVNGHSVISGGSYNLITGGRCWIGGGRNHWADGDFSIVAGGDGNHAIGDNSTILNGAAQVANGGSSTIFSGSSCETGVNANSSAVGGVNLFLDGAQSAMFGRDGYWEANYSFAIAAQKPTGGVDGAAQSVMIAGSARTTNDTLTSTNLSLTLRDTHDWVFSGHVYLNGVDEATHDIVAFAQPVAFKMVAGVTTFYKQTGDYTTPTNTNTAPGSTSEIMSLDSYVDEITVGDCHVRATTGSSASILLRVTGKAATTISWSGSLIGTFTRID